MHSGPVPNSIDFFLKLYASWLVLLVGWDVYWLGIIGAFKTVIWSAICFVFVVFFTFKQKWWIRPLFVLSTVVGVGIQWRDWEYQLWQGMVFDVVLLGFDAAAIYFLYHRNSDQWFKGQYQPSGTLYGPSQQFAQAPPKARPVNTSERVEPTFKGNL